jgi:hypothetical protein
MWTAMTEAQQLWKYVDKDGKVTYSDKPPRKDEKAEPVKHDPNANIIQSPKARAQSDPGSSRESGRAGRSAEQSAADRASAREALRMAVEQAREELENARQALEEGRIPIEEDRRIVVGRNEKGAPTGANQVILKPEYHQRVASLEEAVKRAEMKLEAAETAYAKFK